MEEARIITSVRKQRVSYLMIKWLRVTETCSHLVHYTQKFSSVSCDNEYYLTSMTERSGIKHQKDYIFVGCCLFDYIVKLNFEIAAEESCIKQ